MKKAFLFAIPLSVCNLRCHYCYLSQRPSSYEGVIPEMQFSPEQIAYALRKERVGGESYVNLCADGETLLLPNLARYVELLAREGHYMEIVSNMVLTKKLEPLLELGPEILSHVEFKCSLHYLEFEKKGLLKRFADNVNAAWAAGASCNVEITPSDELVPRIPEVKEYCMESFGALAHLTIARNDATSGIDRLTKLSRDEYLDAWNQFESPFFDFKNTIFGVKQTGFCEAGSWMYYVDMSTGEARQCYKGCSVGNVFVNPDEPLPCKPIGRCHDPHCYNGHTLMTLGLINGATEIGYGDIRDRTREDGTHWLRPELKAFFNTKLGDSNEEPSSFGRAIATADSQASWTAVRVRSKLKRTFGTR